MPRPLIVVTNDDGIKSPGIAAAVQAVRALGDVVVVAPRRQQSSAGRSFSWGRDGARKYRFRVGDSVVPAYSVDASPAVAVRYALHIVTDRHPALLVSGINYGENLGNGLTISGTVMAALEAAAAGVPSIAVSLQTATEFHTSHSTAVDFKIAAHFTRLFARRLLTGRLPDPVKVLNLNVPSHATSKTAWRVTCASRQAYFHSIVNRGKFAGYDIKVDLDTLEEDSDIHAIFVDRVVSVTPLTFDLTAPVDPATLAKRLSDGKR